MMNAVLCKFDDLYVAMIASYYLKSTIRPDYYTSLQVRKEGNMIGSH